MVRPGVSRRVVFLLAGALALSACNSPTSATSAASGAGGSAADDSSSPYGYTAAGFKQCLDDRGVRYREGDHSLTLVDQADAAQQSAADECTRLTTRPVADGESARSNRITQASADCMKRRGYHVTVSPEGTYGDGTPALTQSAPKAEEDSPSFRTDLGECTKAAEEANPAG